MSPTALRWKRELAVAPTPVVATAVVAVMVAAVDRRRHHDDRSGRAVGVVRTPNRDRDTTGGGDRHHRDKNDGDHQASSWRPHGRVPPTMRRRPGRGYSSTFPWVSWP